MSFYEQNHKDIVYKEKNKCGRDIYLYKDGIIRYRDGRVFRGFAPTTVMGNIQTYLFPEKALPHMDSVCHALLKKIIDILLKHWFSQSKNKKLVFRVYTYAMLQIEFYCSIFSIVLDIKGKTLIFYRNREKAHYTISESKSSISLYDPKLFALLESYIIKERIFRTE